MICRVLYACLTFVFFLVPVQLLAAENSTQFSQEEGLVVKSFYCDAEDIKKLEPNVAQIHFVESAGRIKYYKIILKQATKTDYEMLDTNVRNHCMYAEQKPNIATEKVSGAEIYTPKEGTNKQLVRVNDNLILRSPGNESTGFSHLGKIGYSSTGGAAAYHTSSNIFIARDDEVSRSWPVGFTLRETKGAKTLIEGPTSKLYFKDSECAAKDFSTKSPFKCEFSLLDAAGARSRQTISFNAKTLTVESSEGEKQFEVALMDKSGIIGKSGEKAVSLWIDAGRLFISQGKLYEYISKKSVSREVLPEALTLSEETVVE